MVSLAKGEVWFRSFLFILHRTHMFLLIRTDGHSQKRNWSALPSPPLPVSPPCLFCCVKRRAADIIQQRGSLFFFRPAASDTHSSFRMGASLTLLVCPTKRGQRRRKLGGKVRVESGKVLGGGHMLHQLEKEEEGREEKERRECAAPLGPGSADFIVPPIGGSFYKQCGPSPPPLPPKVESGK